MTRDEVVQRAREHGARFIRFLYCDTAGVIRGKAVHIDILGDRLRNGVGLPIALQGLNILDQLQPVENLGPVGEVRLVPDTSTFHALPYVPHQAALTCDLLDSDGGPWALDARSLLRYHIDRAATRGLGMQVAFENEFTLLNRTPEGQYLPFDQSPTYSAVGMTNAAGFIDDLGATFEMQGLTVEHYHPEGGPGQQELTIRHADTMRAADNQVIFRETVRGVASKHGILASFAPKPIADQPGNGAHIHFSLWDSGFIRNRLYDPEALYGLTPLARSFLAGVLAHLPALTALTCPTYNSYRRLHQPRSWTSAFTAWGPDNREAAVRVASGLWGADGRTVNLELRPVDPSCNPYLALAGLIAAGIDGVDKEMDPGEPVQVDPATLPNEDREAQGIQLLPTSQMEAMLALRADPVMMSALGRELAAVYLAVHTSEYAAFRRETAGFEIQHHLLKF